MWISACLVQSLARAPAQPQAWSHSSHSPACSRSPACLAPRQGHSVQIPLDSSKSSEPPPDSRVAARGSAASVVSVEAGLERTLDGASVTSSLGGARSVGAQTTRPTRRHRTSKRCFSFGSPSASKGFLHEGLPSSAVILILLSYCTSNWANVPHFCAATLGEKGVFFWSRSAHPTCHPTCHPSCRSILWELTTRMFRSPTFRLLESAPATGGLVSSSRSRRGAARFRGSVVPRTSFEGVLKANGTFRV